MTQALPGLPDLGAPELIIIVLVIAAVLGAVANGILGPGGESDAGSITAATEAVFVAVLIAAVLAGVAALTIPKTPVAAPIRAETGPIDPVTE